MTLEALMREAASAVDAGDLRRAEPLLQHIVGLNPRDAEAWHMLAIIALRAGRASEAIDSATRALRLDRRNHLYLNTLGVAHGDASRLEEAVRLFRRALNERPTYAEGHYNLGKVYEKLANFPDAERCYMRARQLDPDNAAVVTNLGLLYLRIGRCEQALGVLAQGRSAFPMDETIAINYSTAVLATSGCELAAGELGAFVARNPEAWGAHAELGRLLLAMGRFAEGWSQYAWRHGSRPPESRELTRTRVLLLPDQGLGDHLFFLRFAPALRRRAAHVAFACPPQLMPLLRGNPVVDELVASADKSADFDARFPVGDLPRLLDDTSTPAPFEICIEPARLGEWHERLAALGPPPYLGVTWRGGGQRKTQSEFAARGESPLRKEIEVQQLAAALRGWPGTVLGLQRVPKPRELEEFSRSLGAPVYDFSTVNDDLVAMGALLSVLDEYVGVSNTNMHLRAAVGKAGRVLVPFPHEFRWMESGRVSPWFPGFSVYRQTPQRNWQDALGALIRDLNV
jgi:Flp pilus assembly protein TadD